MVNETKTKKFWSVRGDEVTLCAAGLEPRFRHLHYEFLLSTLLADPRKQIQFLSKRLWWQDGMAAELLAIAGGEVRQ